MEKIIDLIDEIFYTNKEFEKQLLPKSEKDSGYIEISNFNSLDSLNNIKIVNGNSAMSLQIDNFVEKGGALLDNYVNGLLNKLGILE